MNDVISTDNVYRELTAGQDGIFTLYFVFCGKGI
jgi:hypothetical protein